MLVILIDPGRGLKLIASLTASLGASNVKHVSTGEAETAPSRSMPPHSEGTDLVACGYSAVKADLGMSPALAASPMT